MAQETEQLDYLATEVLTALENNLAMSPSWIAGKKHEFKEMDRLQVLRSLSNLDAENLLFICVQLNCKLADLEATFRVLQKI